MSEEQELPDNTPKGLAKLSTPMITAISAIALALIGLAGRYIDRINTTVPDCDNTIIVKELSKTVVKQSDEINAKSTTIEHLRTIIEEKNQQLWKADKNIQQKVVNPLKNNNHEK